ncbi:MAG: FAD-dependent oxidoreductase [Chloracidobacterium sp.]|nr:FAD-dependent oxidoreductase [Chloracidobacterium sp.]
MNNSIHETEVVIIGAGIVGAHNAIQCAKRGMRVTLIDKIVGQKRSFKVGESLLVFSNMFLRTISELDEYNQKAFPKDGVWFTYGMEGRADFDQRAEWAIESKIPQIMRDSIINKNLLRALVDDVQIVRPEAEDLMRETARSHPKIRFIDTAKVRDVLISKDGGLHELVWQDDFTKGKNIVRARWIIDCSGRNRILTKKMGHAIEDVVCQADGFRNSCVWAQFCGIKDELFADVWRHKFTDGTVFKRDLNTLHLWGDGYWIWVIRLSDERVSIGVSFDHRTPPPGRDYREQFWTIIRRYRIFDNLLFEENALEYHFFKNCQHMTDTFVSPHRYGMAGDAASVIDAYYSQGVSLALVSSWHICNIIEQDLRHGRLDRKYIDRVNKRTVQDWFMMRNIVKEKYTKAISDGRFFVLSHLLDMVTFVNIALPRYQLVKWLIATEGGAREETAVYKKIRKSLSKKLYFSSRLFISPAAVSWLQGRLQQKLGERARWRLDHGVKSPNLRCIVRTPGGLINFWRLLLSRKKSFLDISPSYMAEPPKWMRLTGEEISPFLLRLAGPVMTILFFIMYFYDWAATSAAKLRFAFALSGTATDLSDSIHTSSTSEKSSGD